MRLHVRAMIRDGDTAFVGSQSLRALELDARREVGLIVKDPKVVKTLAGGLRRGLGEDRPGQEGTEAVQKELKLAESEEVVARDPPYVDRATYADDRSRATVRPIRVEA